MKNVTQIADFQKGNGKVIEPIINRARRPEPSSARPDLVCLSHLRWDFVTQRPQHLLSRCAKYGRVFFVEEPVFDEGSARLEISQRDSGVWVVVPHLPDGLQSSVAVEAMMAGMIDRLFAERGIREHVLWYYTPMALGFTRHLRPLATVYDCMDELSAFKGAPPELHAREAELFRRADLVFTGGQSLYEAKRDKHPAVYAFPSSIDRAHFAQAREPLAEPDDQAAIPRPRLGFFGVLDERFDAALLDAVAAARPDWQLVMIGPVVKIDPASLPRRANVHYLGGKRYEELPAYLSGWDVALMPFAINESTRYISPTKTPEYLAAGKPVVSTPIRDVVRPYGTQGLVEIAATAEEFVAAAECSLSAGDRGGWLARVDAFLAQNSWDETWARMSRLIDEVVASHRTSGAPAARAASASAGRASQNLSAGIAAS
jgi:UDP-galactopyranose mutase